MLAVHEDALAAVEMARREAHAPIEVLLVDAAHVLGRQMEQRDAVAAKQRCVVDVLVAQVDDGADPCSRVRRSVCSGWKLPPTARWSVIQSKFGARVAWSSFGRGLRM